jgi:hypothetical protein
MKVKNAICRRGARKLLLETPEKLLNQEYQEFDIDWSSINAPWIKVDVAGGMFHFMQSQCFVQILPVPEMFSGIESVSFGTEADRLKDSNYFPESCWGTILRSMRQEEIDILSDQVTLLLFH